HGDPVGCLEDHAKSGPDQLLVVGHDDPDGFCAGHGAGHGAGNRAVTANPPASPGPTVRLPPQDATRSAMPARPNPPDTAGRAPPPLDEAARHRLACLPRVTAAAAFPVSVTDTVT